MPDNVVNLNGITVEKSELEVFMKEETKRMAKLGYDKVLILGLNTDDGYRHSMSSHNLKQSECVSLLEITKSTLMRQMENG